MASLDPDTSALGRGPVGAARYSFSGRERNKLFIARPDGKFADDSYFGGADSIADGRSVALADFDRDGDVDLAVANRNAPLLQLFRNTASPTKSSVIALSVEGSPSERSSRDAIGAVVSATCGSLTATRHVNGGAGFASQNSRVLTIGVGQCDTIDALRVTWPNGRRRVFKQVATNAGYHVSESSALEPVQRYYDNRAKRTAMAARAPVADAAAMLTRGEQLAYVELWATWCDTCKEKLPEVASLAREFEGRVAVTAMSVESTDDADKVAAYRTRHNIDAYPVLAFDGAIVAQLLVPFGGTAPALPAGVLVNRAGEVLWHGSGVPTRSDIRAALARASAKVPLPELKSTPKKSRLIYIAVAAVGVTGIILVLIIVFAIRRRSDQDGASNS